MMIGRLRALVVLGFSLLRALVRRALGQPSGLPLFEQNYRDDRLPALTSHERAQMPAFSRCIACGLCDVGEGERIAASQGAYPGLMHLVLASSRSMPDYDAAVRGFAHVPEEVLEAKEPLCPTGVPFRELATFVRHKAVFEDDTPRVNKRTS